MIRIDKLTKILIYAICLGLAVLVVKLFIKLLPALIVIYIIIFIINIVKNVGSEIKDEHTHSIKENNASAFSTEEDFDTTTAVDVDFEEIE